MTEQSIQEVSAITAEPVLHHVHSVAATIEVGVFILDVEITDSYGETYRAMHCSRPNDPYGLGPAIRQWLIENPDFPIAPYIPPTEEQLRAAMPALPRLTFRNKFKAAGMTTAVINNAIAAIEDESVQEDMQIAWEDTQSFGRLDPFVVMVATFTGKTPEQIDMIWTD